MNIHLITEKNNYIMKRLLIIYITFIGFLNILAQGYRNPVLPGFHADSAFLYPDEKLIQFPRLQLQAPYAPDDL